MLLNKLIADVEARAGVTKAFQLLLGASLLTNVLMAGAFLTMDRTVRTVLVPPEVTKSFWVDGRAIGPEYLEQMGSWIIQQFATVTPATIDYQSAMLLKYIHPSQYGELAVRFKMGANRIKAENLSKIFMPREMRISEKGQEVALIGVQSTWIADKRVPGDEIKAYLVGFDYDGSRVTIRELRETNPQRPFDPPSEQQVAAAAEAAAQQELPTAAVTTAAPTQDNGVQNQIRPNTGLPPAPPPAVSPSAEEALRGGVAPLQNPR